MIAVVASVLLTLYLVVPASIFRWLFGLFVPLRNFQRTPGEEIVRGALSLVFPVLATFLLFWLIPYFAQHPFGFQDTPNLRRADYRIVFGGLYDGESYREAGRAFWQSITRSGRRQGRFIIWFYGLVMFEGVLFGGLSIAYPWLTSSRLYTWAAKHILLRNISEWHLLLTPFFFKHKKQTTVWADLLCSEGMLYRGKVIDHTVDLDGQLSGVTIAEAKRFRREDYVSDRKTNAALESKDYWRPIPGERLYVLSSKILNINISYETTEPPPKLMAKLVSRKLNQPIDVTIDRAPPTE